MPLLSCRLGPSNWTLLGNAHLQGLALPPGLLGTGEESTGMLGERTKL